MPMQPKPSADTSKWLFPSLRFCMTFRRPPINEMRNLGARRLDVVRNLFHGRKPYLALGLDVRDQPIELHDPRSASAHMRMLREDEHRPFLKGEIELGLVDLEHRIR